MTQHSTLRASVGRLTVYQVLHVPGTMSYCQLPRTWYYREPRTLLLTVPGIGVSVPNRLSFCALNHLTFFSDEKPKRIYDENEDDIP